MSKCAGTKLRQVCLPALCVGCGGRQDGSQRHGTRCANGSASEQCIWHLMVLSRAFVGQGLICVGGFFSRVVLLQEWSVKERSSIGLVSALCYGCFTPDLIKTLSLIRLCLGQTSLCVFYSGSSLLRWPWTMSGETVGFFSVSVTAVESCRNPKRALDVDGEGLCRLKRTATGLWLVALPSVVFFTQQAFSS